MKRLFKSEKCDQRARIDGARYGVNAFPLRYLGDTLGAASRDFQTFNNSADMPDSPVACLKLINLHVPPGAPALKESDVYIQFFEAANNNFVSDRAMHMGHSTLQNIAAGACDGVSFMNSHRTGALSEPTELPFGHTFCGTYQEGYRDGRFVSRALVGVYMARGVLPNGVNGPSTDDLATMFNTGALRDVSVGLYDGNTTCDVCGNSMEYDDPAAYTEVDDGHGGKNRVMKCNHVPGTTRNMSEDDVAAQVKSDSDNKKGVASYTLHNCTLGELSAVYDGAVPGAGIQRVLSFVKHNEMSPESLRELLVQAYDFYGPLLPFDLGEVVKINAPANNLRGGKGNLVAIPPKILQAARDLAAHFQNGGDDTPPTDDAATDGAAPAEAAPAAGGAPAGEPAASDAAPADVAPDGEPAASDAAPADGAPAGGETELMRLRRQVADLSRVNLQLQGGAPGPEGEAAAFVSQVRPFCRPASHPYLAEVYSEFARLDAKGKPFAVSIVSADGKTHAFTNRADLLRSFMVSLGKTGVFEQIPATEATGITENPVPQTEVEVIRAAVKQEVAEFIGMQGSQQSFGRGAAAAGEKK